MLRCTRKENEAEGRLSLFGYCFVYCDWKFEGKKKTNPTQTFLFTDMWLKNWQCILWLQGSVKTKRCQLAERRGYNKEWLFGWNAGKLLERAFSRCLSGRKWSARRMRKRQRGVTGTPITRDWSLGTRRNVLQLTGGLFCGLFVCHTNCQPRSLKSPDSVFFFSLVCFSPPSSFIMSQPAKLQRLSLLHIYNLMRILQPPRGVMLAGHVTVSSSLVSALVSS